MTSICHKQFFLSHLLTPGINHISSVRNTEAALGTIQPQVLIPGKSVQNDSHHIRALAPKGPEAGNKCTLYRHQPPFKTFSATHGMEGSSRYPLLYQRKKWMAWPSENTGRFQRGPIIPVMVSQAIGKNSFTIGSITWSHENCSRTLFLSRPGSWALIT